MSSIEVVADTLGEFEDFAPYVPSINNHGVVAFQAKVYGGSTGVFTSLGGEVRCEGSMSVVSHPDVNTDGSLCFYGCTEDGFTALVVRCGEMTAVFGETVGPLGPTMNEIGAVAFRANGSNRREEVCLISNCETQILATAGEEIRGFQGLPVMVDDGSVVFRADMVDGDQRIYRAFAGGLSEIAHCRGVLNSLGSFPSVNKSGSICFAGTLKTGVSGIFAARNGSVEPVVESGHGFDSFRGALIDDHGRIVFYATPPSGSLGIYLWDGELATRILGIGDGLFSSRVVDFALNPVSINSVGQLAIRIGLENGRQIIGRYSHSG